MVSLFLSLSLTLRIANFEHIWHLAQREICQNTSFILEKRKKSNKFSILQIEVFFLPNITGFYGMFFWKFYEMFRLAFPWNNS